MYALYTSSCQKYESKVSSGETLHIAIGNEIRSLDIRSSRDKHSYRISQLIFQRLLILNNKSELVEDMAFFPRIQNNQKFTFTLKPATFHNQKAVRAEDIIASIKGAIKPRTPLFIWLKNIKTIKKVSHNKIQIELKTSDPSFLKRTIPLLGIMPEEIALNKSNYKAIGSGPYMLEELKNYKIVLKKNPHYANKDLYKQIHIHSILDQSTRLLALQKNRVQVLWDPPKLNLLDILETKKREKIHTLNGHKITYIAFNQKKKHMREIQKTLEENINKEMLIKPQWKKFIKSTNSFLPKEHSYFCTNNRKKESQKRIEPPKTEFTILTPNLPTIQNWISSLSDQIKALKLNVKIKSLDFALFLKEIRKETFDAFVFYYGTKTDPSVLKSLFYTNAYFNRMNYSSEAFDKIIERDTETPKRKKLYCEAQKELSLKQPVIPLLIHKEILVTKENIKQKNSFFPLWMSILNLP